MKRVLVIAPHPDDETIGCGGTILRHISEGDEVYWLVVTDMSMMDGVSEKRLKKRQNEILQVSNEYKFSEFFQLGFPATLLDSLKTRDLVSSFSNIFNKVKPELLYLPYRSDIHSDHQIVFDTASACTKTFRYPFIKKIRIYQTLSETEFNIDPQASAFKPNCLIDITSFIDKKIEIMKIYESELGEHPFPRSEEGMRAQSLLLGSLANTDFAEGFITVREIL